MLGLGTWGAMLAQSACMYVCELVYASGSYPYLVLAVHQRIVYFAHYALRKGFDSVNDTILSSHFLVVLFK